MAPHRLSLKHRHPLHARNCTVRSVYWCGLLQDSDERAVAFIAGKAPPRWGPFGADPPTGPPVVVVPPVIPPPNATPAELARAAQIRRAHPLYADVSLRLLTEIMNSRLFTTVRCSGRAHGTPS